jgi:hypothetical protein
MKSENLLLILLLPRIAITAGSILDKDLTFFYFYHVFVGHSRVVYLKDKMKLSLRVINEAPRH